MNESNIYFFITAIIFLGAGIVFTRKGDFIVAVLTKYINSNSAPSKEFITRISLHAYKYFEQL